MLRTPAFTAAIAPSSPCACAWTGTFFVAASSTIARISFSVYTCLRGSVSAVPARSVARILIQSTPCERFICTARRIFSIVVTPAIRSA
jgi:hypothetical protein